LFPWLSQVASRYETYKFRRVRFNYHTQAATTQVGNVTLAFDFDTTDPAPVTQMQALSYRDRVYGAPWTSFSLDLDLAQGDKLPSRFTRVGLPASPYDLKTFDLGRLHVCVEGVAAATVGLLEVEYVVDLFTPQIEDGVGGNMNATTGLDATHLFGNYTVDPQGFMPFTVTSTSVITFNQYWEGIIVFEIGGTVLSANYNPVVAGGGVTAVTGNQIVNAGGTIVRGAFRVRAIPGTTITPTITATTVTAAYYNVASVGYNQIDS